MIWEMRKWRGGPRDLECLGEQGQALMLLRRPGKAWGHGMGATVGARSEAGQPGEHSSK